jgi:hypothetical protein
LTSCAVTGTNRNVVDPASLVICRTSRKIDR